MTKLSHQLTGVAGAFAVYLFTHNPICAFLFYVGSITPDVDVLWNNLSEYNSKWYAHRGFTHSILIPLILFSLAVMLYIAEGFSVIPIFQLYENKFLNLSLRWSLLIALFSLGYSLHLFLDSMSPSGIPKTFSYYPRLKLWVLYRVGSPTEYLIVLLFCLLVMGISVLLNLDYLDYLRGLLG